MPPTTSLLVLLVLFNALSENHVLSAMLRNSQPIPLGSVRALNTVPGDEAAERAEEWSQPFTVTLKPFAVSFWNVTGPLENDAVQDFHFYLDELLRDFLTPTSEDFSAAAPSSNVVFQTGILAQNAVTSTSLKGAKAVSPELQIEFEKTATFHFSVSSFSDELDASSLVPEAAALDAALSSLLSNPLHKRVLMQKMARGTASDNGNEFQHLSQIRLILPSDNVTFTYSSGPEEQEGTLFYDTPLFWVAFCFSSLFIPFSLIYIDKYHELNKIRRNSITAQWPFREEEISLSGSMASLKDTDGQRQKNATQGEEGGPTSLQSGDKNQIISKRSKSFARDRKVPSSASVDASKKHADPNSDSDSTSPEEMFECTLVGGKQIAITSEKTNEKSDQKESITVPIKRSASTKSDASKKAKMTQQLLPAPVLTAKSEAESTKGIEMTESGFKAGADFSPQGSGKKSSARSPKKNVLMKRKDSSSISVQGDLANETLAMLEQRLSDRKTIYLNGNAPGDMDKAFLYFVTGLPLETVDPYPTVKKWAFEGMAFMLESRGNLRQSNKDKIYDIIFNRMYYEDVGRTRSSPSPRSPKSRTVGGGGEEKKPSSSPSKKKAAEEERRLRAKRRRQLERWRRNELKWRRSFNYSKDEESSEGDNASRGEDAAKETNEVGDEDREDLMEDVQEESKPAILNCLAGETNCCGTTTQSRDEPETAQDSGSGKSSFSARVGDTSEVGGGGWV